MRSTEQICECAHYFNDKRVLLAVWLVVGRVVGKLQIKSAGSLRLGFLRTSPDQWYRRQCHITSTRDLPARAKNKFAIIIGNDVD